MKPIFTGGFVLMLVMLAIFIASLLAPPGVFEGTHQ